MCSLHSTSRVCDNAVLGAGLEQGVLLLQVMRDLKTLTIAFQPLEACTAAERELLTVSSAKASLAWRQKSQQAQSALKQVCVGSQGTCCSCDGYKSCSHVPDDGLGAGQ